MAEDSDSRSDSLDGSAPQTPASSKCSNCTPPPADSTSKAPSHSKKQGKQASSNNESAATGKVTKRRAARACVSCRQRKVRCDVVETGAPCGNCRWDGVQCVVQESRRRKKHNPFHGQAQQTPYEAYPARNVPGNSLAAGARPVAITTADHPRRPSSAALMTGVEPGVPGVVTADGARECLNGHVPHLIYRQRTPMLADPAGLMQRLSFTPSLHPQQPQFMSPVGVSGTISQRQLPPFVYPLPDKIDEDDVIHLRRKGALALPDPVFQNVLIRAYVEYVHPFMPLLELHDFLRIVDGKGLAGKVSLFLYQAVLFAASAFVDLKYLIEAGFPNRKAARKAFFTRARLLYDLDYESDRLVLVQALLLMTYWYETPDDQKDTWHWMGVAISIAHTIGLHRNPANTRLSPDKQKVWKRVWWSCYMRDRLIALGMRRATRIKEEDFDVPMLEEVDFEIGALPPDNQVFSAECCLIRDVDMQHQLALMCIEKAKLCVCISHMLQAQYSVLNRDNLGPDNTSGGTMMLFPNKTFDNLESVRRVDAELEHWYASLPTCCQYRTLEPAEVDEQNATLAVHRTLMHMVYQTTVSALHRPQVASQVPPQLAVLQIQQASQRRVQDAAAQTTKMAAELHVCKLDRFLPTTGVTVIVPAMIIHLVGMNNPNPDQLRRTISGYRACEHVLNELRELYAAADFATTFLRQVRAKFAPDERVAVPHAMNFRRPVESTLNGISIAPELNLGGLNHAATAKPEQEILTAPPRDKLSVSNPAEADFYHHRNVDPTILLGPTHPQSEGEAGSSRLTPSQMVPDEAMIWSGGVPDNSLDFSQWLDFPSEGASNSDETFSRLISVDPNEMVVDSKENMEWFQPCGHGHHVKFKEESFAGDVAMTSTLVT